jgi:sialate O-acetylesterase
MVQHWIRVVALCAFGFAAASSAGAQLVVFPPVSRGAVLQRGASVRVRGRAPAPGAVVVEANWPGAKPVAGVAGSDGAFAVEVATGAAGGPYELVVRAGDAAVSLGDLLLGDVWLCSGQSNMEWEMRQNVAGAAEDVRRTNLPLVRHFKVKLRTAAAPLASVEGEWIPCDPEHGMRFTAVGFHFAATIQPQLGIPIGILNSSWGGTPAESWVSGEAIAAHGGFADHLARLESLAKGPAPAPLAVRRRAWWKTLDEVDPGVAGGYASSQHDDREWTAVRLPDRFTGELERFDGVVWYRRTIEVPAAWAGRELALELGPIDDGDVAYWNGAVIGDTRDEGAWNRPRRYRVPAQAVVAGRATLALRVIDFAGAGAVGSAEVAARISPVDEPGAAHALAEGWRRKVGVALDAARPYPREDELGPHVASTLYNAMIAPLTGFPVRGALWYQGESNVGRAEQYRTLFPALIADWRARFARPELPFYFVQIAPFAYGGDQGAAAELRMAQEHAARTVPGTGMVVLSDVGDPRDIHPRDKTTVGRRLAAFALTKTYGRPGAAPESPRPIAAVRRGAALVIGFEFGAGLRTRDGAPVRYAELQGEDGRYAPATATIEGESLVLSADGVAAPVAARFAYGAADEPNLVNGVGLPAGPFRIAAAK